jgi:hypothetical protein
MSVMGATVESADPAEYELRSGIPVCAASLHEVLLARCGEFEFHGSDEDGRSVFTPAAFAANYPIEWLRAVPMGADLRTLPVRFVGWLLRDLVDPANANTSRAAPAVRAAITAVTTLLDEQARAGSPPDSQWAVARHDAVAAADDARDAISLHLAVLAESVAWPAETICNELPGHVNSFWFSLAELCMRPYMPNELVARQEALALGLAEMQRLAGEPGFERDAFVAERPLLKRALDDFRDAEHMTRLQEFKKLALPDVLRIAERHFSALLRLTAA